MLIIKIIQNYFDFEVLDVFVFCASRPGHSKNGLQVIVSHFSFIRSQHSVSKWSVLLDFFVSAKLCPSPDASVS